MDKRRFIGFSVMEVAYWGFHASCLCYASAYVLSNGISNTVLSLLISAYMMCAFVGSVIWGRICDVRKTNKRVFMPCMAASYLLVLMIYCFVENIWILSVSYPLLGFFFQPQGANADAWVLSTFDHDQRIYGKIRSMPSLFYAVISAAAGTLINRFGYTVMVFGATLFAVLALLTAALLPDERSVSQERRSMGAADVRRLFASMPYRRLIILLFLIGLACAPVNNLKIVVFNSVGGDVADVGMDSFIGAMTQVPFIAMAGMIALIPLGRRFIMMTLLPMMMILCTSFAVSPALVFAGTFLYNAGFGVILSTMRDVTEKYVDKDLRNLGHNLSDAMFNSFSGVLGLTYAGAITDRFGVRAMLALSAGIAALPVLLSLRKPGKGKNSGSTDG